MKFKIVTLLFIAVMLVRPDICAAQSMSLQQTLKAMTELLAQQQKELEAQRKEMAEQRKEMAEQRQALAEQRTLIEQIQGNQSAAKAAPKSAPVEEPPTPVPAIAQDSTPAVQTTGAPPNETPSAQDQAKDALVQKQKVSPPEDVLTDLQAAMDDPSNTIYDKEFPGAWYLPGTAAAMKLGGYVNLSAVNNFDPMLIPDSFIVGSIPPKGTNVPGAVEGSSVSANQTRVNLEYREQTKLGEIRAFVEGDFRESNDTFRLRHAFGQFRTFLAGQTWSTFMDIDSQPEEVDIEGINGKILVRQSLVRWSPEFGNIFNLKLALEDPQTYVTGGVSERGRADLVASLNRMPLGPTSRWNHRVAFVLRDLSATLADPGSIEDRVGIKPDNTTGWGITTSGRQPVTWWGDQKDFLLWQLTYGKGVGRYINDLGSIECCDAVFDPEDKLRALPVWAGYASYQHLWPMNWGFVKSWPGILRSSLTLSFVDIKNYDFQDGSHYNKTIRASANLIYNPADNVMVGFELLWGKRQNKDKSEGSASQLQIAARYSF
jgi:hypothetical protein